MKNFLIILIFILAIILQVSAAPFLVVFNTGPNLILILILTLVVLKTFEKTWWIIVLTGFLIELFSGLPFGLISLSLIGSVYSIDWLNRNVFSTTNFWTMISLIIFGSLIYSILIIILAILFQIDLILNLQHLFIELLYNLIMAIIFLYAAKKIFY
ncbi:MAG: hypothetical protein ISS02_00915 [Candidatus Portnoybacteria bacterium]|nr:hypothetical protein [Candidatus Portnoybacteria bacterium]